MFDNLDGEDEVYGEEMAGHRRSELSYVPAISLARANTPKTGHRPKAFQRPKKLPASAKWTAVILTAVAMAFLNIMTVFSMEFLVAFKWNSLQRVIDNHGAVLGILTLMGIAMGFALVATCLIHGICPEAGGSGAPENKGWLNGVNNQKMFTWTTLCVRFVATICSNATGYPVGREGPTVTMGSNIGFLITKIVALFHFHTCSQTLNIVRSVGVGGFWSGAVDEVFFLRSARVVCAVGGACGMAMIFNSPIGGIIYMFEEMTSTAWLVELTFKAFVGTAICCYVSYIALFSMGSNITSFVLFEDWDGTRSQDYGLLDVPGFLVVSIFLGFFAPLHTSLAVAVLDRRKQMHAGRLLKRRQPYAKMTEAVLYAAFCAAVAGAVSLSGGCHILPDGGFELLSEESYVRFHCPEGQYSPVASLLLTTAEGAVKRLFCRTNTGVFGLRALVGALVAYTTVNIGLTGVPVPSGNFTGTMLIGGLVGRLGHHILAALFPTLPFASPGIYAMVGSAAMLAGFKQMSVAVVLFISQASNNFGLIQALMLPVGVSLGISRCLRSTAYDEAQIERKQIPILQAEPSRQLRSCTAAELLDELPAVAVLTPNMSPQQVREALHACSTGYLPVVEETRCVGVIPRHRIEAALSENTAQLERTDISLAAIADPASFVIMEDATVRTFYPIFAKAHSRACCVVSRGGEYRGVLSREGIAMAAMRLGHQETHGKALLRPNEEQLSESASESDGSGMRSDSHE